MSIEKKYKKHHRTSARGFSIIEILVSISIFTLLLFGMYAVQKEAVSLNDNYIGRLSTQNEVRKAMATISREIRTVAPSSVGAYPLADVSTSSFIFYSNIDGDAYVEKVRYFLDGTTLKRGVIKPGGSPLAYNSANENTSELIHDVANGSGAIFTYYGENYNGTGPSLVEPFDVTLVRLTKIEVIVDKDPQQTPVPQIFSTQINMRNLKDNL